MDLLQFGATAYSSISNTGLGARLELHRENIRGRMSEIFSECFGELESPVNPEILGKIDSFFHEFENLLDTDSELSRALSMLPGGSKREILEMYPEYLLEYMGITIPSEEELKKQIEDLNKKCKLQVKKLLDESDVLSHELGYDILPFVILVTGEIHGVGELIKSNGGEIEEYHFLEPSDFPTNIRLSNLRASEKESLGYIEGKKMLEGGKIIQGLSRLEKEFIGGNMSAAFEIGKYYESIVHPEAQRYLNYAYISGVGEAFVHIGEKRAKDSDDILGRHEYRSILEIGSYQFGSLACFRAYINDFSNRSDKKDALKLLMREDRIVDADWRFFTEYLSHLESNNWSIELSDCNDEIQLKYKKYAEDFCGRLQRIFGVEFDVKSILESLSFSFMDGKFSDPGGDYNLFSGKIRIDYFFHIDGAIIQNPENFENFFGTFCHENIHKVSIESSELGLSETPRFINEGLTSLVEEIISGYDSKSYPTERKIVKKLIELSCEDEMYVYGQFLIGNFAYISDIFNPNIGKILEIFSEDEDFNGENDFISKIGGKPSLKDEVNTYLDHLRMFEAFGLRLSTTKDEVIKAWKNLVRENHPDRGGKEDAFKKINLAKEEIFESRGWNKKDTSSPEISGPRLIELNS